MKKGSTVVHWTKADDATIARLRAKGETWESVAKAVSTKKLKRSAEATMQRARYIAGKQKPKTSRLKTARGVPRIPRPTLPTSSMPTASASKSVTIGGQTFSLPKV